MCRDLGYGCASQDLTCVLPHLLHRFTGKNTFFGKTATLLQADNEMGHLQKILLTVRL